MAIFHLCLKHISRTDGSSACAAAAYRSGSVIADDYYGIVCDYTGKDDVKYTEIIAPENTPERLLDRQALWNEVERIEKHPRADLAFSFDMALPKELPLEVNKQIMQEFVRDNMVSRGMICDVAIHVPQRKDKNKDNVHGHVMCPSRKYENGEWCAKQRREYLLDANGKYVYKTVPTTDWREKETLIEWRKNWAELVNRKLKEYGIDQTIDHRSYKERGIDQIPQIHEGVAVRHMEKKGIRTDIGAWNRWIRDLTRRMKDLKESIKELVRWIGELKTELFTPRERESWEVVYDVDAYYDAEYERVKQKYPYAHSLKADILCENMDLFAYIRMNNLYSYNALDQMIRQKYVEVEAFEEMVAPQKKQIAELKKTIRNINSYENNQPVYQEMTGIFFKKRKEQFKTDHKKELNEFYRARRELGESYKPEEADGIKASAEAEIENLQKEVDAHMSGLAYERLKDEIEKLKKIRKCVDYARRKREKQGTGEEQQARAKDKEQGANTYDTPDLKQTATKEGVSFKEKLKEMKEKQAAEQTEQQRQQMKQRETVLRKRGGDGLE